MSRPWDMTEAERRQFREAHARKKEKHLPAVSPDEFLRNVAGQVRKDHAGPPDGFWAKLAGFLESQVDDSALAIWMDDGSLYQNWHDDPAAYATAVDLARAYVQPGEKGGGLS